MPASIAAIALADGVDAVAVAVVATGVIVGVVIAFALFAVAVVFAGGIGGAGGGVLSAPPHAKSNAKAGTHRAVRMPRMYSRNAVQGNP